MASEESRRVADYFVVCGLPKDNPQPLDDTSLEVSLRSTAHQDPITDITVRLHLNQSEIMYKGQSYWRRIIESALLLSICPIQF